MYQLLKRYYLYLTTVPETTTEVFLKTAVLVLGAMAVLYVFKASGLYDALPQIPITNDTIKGLFGLGD